MAGIDVDLVFPEAVVKRERDLRVSPMALQDPLGTVHP